MYDVIVYVVILRLAKEKAFQSWKLEPTGYLVNKYLHENIFARKMHKSKICNRKNC